MTWEFVLVVLVVVLMPGVDLLMVLHHTIAGDRRIGTATTAGIGAASAIQGAFVAVGVGAIVVQSQWFFQLIRWVGIAYLLFLGMQALRSAFRAPVTESRADGGSVVGWSRGFRRGFLCNITNPKMFVFYLSLLPQFVSSEASVGTWLLHAWALPLIGSAWLLVVVVAAAAVRNRLLQPLVRRIIDGVAGAALLGFGSRLALDH